MDPEKVKAAVEAIKNGDAAAALSILEEMIVSAAGGGDPASDSAPEPLEDAPDPKPEDEQVAATALMRLTGAPSVGAAILECDRIKARLEKDESDRVSADRVARRDLVAELVKLGVEFPATAWAGDAAQRVPVNRLAEEPLEELRTRVELHRKAPRQSAPAKPPAGGPGPGDGSTTITTPHGVVTLSKGELANCKQYGADVNDYAANKAIHLAARGEALK